MKRLHTVFAFAVALTFVIAGCDSILKGQEVPSDAASGESQARGIVPGQANVVEVTATHDRAENEHLFELSTDEVPSGWTTFEFSNASHSDHFVLLYEAPQAAIDAAEDANQPLLEHWYETVTVPFQEEFDPYIAGEIGYGTFVDNLIEAVSQSAPWFFDPGATPQGGPGLTAVGRTSETTVNLQSGTYIMECYVKDEDEEFHSYNGMLEMLTVTDEESGARQPRATLEMSVSQPSEGGIEIPEKVRPGKHTVAIHFGAQPQGGYEHFQGHNAHLVRLEDDADLDELAAWMDWRQEDALAVRAPEGAEFLGGTMEMLGGETAYYTVNLKPGDYAWIAEVPEPDEKGMLKTFSVPSGRANGR